MEPTPRWQSTGLSGAAPLLSQQPDARQEHALDSALETVERAPETTKAGGASGDVPPAYYSDGPPILPPPGDPHWREWPEGAAHEPSPRWIPTAIAGFLVCTCLVHILFIFLLVH